MKPDDAQEAQRELTELGGEVARHLEETDARILDMIRLLRGLAAVRRYEEMPRVIHALESALDVRQRLFGQLRYLRRLRDKMDEWAEVSGTLQPGQKWRGIKGGGRV